MTLRMGIDDILPQLERVKRSASGYTARCPAHEDNHASLSIGESEDGKILLHCFAGCDYDSIAINLGIPIGDVPFNAYVPHRAERGTVATGQSTLGDMTKERPIAEYVYTDAASNPAYRVLRLRGKKFLQERFEHEVFAPGIAGTDRLLYRLPALLGADAAFVVEGEKDADNLAKLGLAATCCAGGASSWGTVAEHAREVLSGKTVYILPDNDPPGKAYAKAVYSSLRGHAKSAVVVELPGLGPKQDVSDWLEAGGTKEKLLELCKAAKEPPQEEQVTEYTRNEFAVSLNKIARGLQRGDGIDAVITNLEDIVNKLDLHSPASVKSTSMGDLAKASVDRTMAILRGEINDDRGIKTGLSALDAVLGALSPGALHIVAGRPGMGKSALARCIAWYAAQQGIKVAFFPLEESSVQLTYRLLSQLSGIPLHRIRSHDLTSYDTTKLADAAGHIHARAGFSVYDGGGANVRHIHSAASGQGLIVIDYLQLVASKGKNRLEEVNSIVRSLVATAKEHNAVILAVSQLSRGVEYRDDKTPMLSDLRDSGEIEQAADTVTFCYRPSYYRSGGDPERAELIVAKNKHGPTGTAVVRWLAETTTFVDY